MADWDDISVPVQRAPQQQADPWEAISAPVADEPAPQPLPPARVPEYDPMAFAIASMNAQEVAKAQAAQEEQVKPPSNVFGRIYQSLVETKAARKQGAAPMVRDRQGNFVRKPIGDIEEYDAGPLIRRGNDVVAFNPKTDVMLRDPVTQRLMAFERSPELDGARAEAGGFGSTLMEGFAVGPVSRVASSNAIPMAVQRAAALGFPVPAKTYQMGARARDAAAFNALGVEPFAPAFRSKGAARFARTVEEMPVLGGIVKSPKTDTEQALASAQARIATDLGAATTSEQAGRVLQGGLERFRTAGIADVEPSALAGVRGVEQLRPRPEMVGPMPQGITARGPVQPQPFMSGGALERAGEAAPIRSALVAQDPRAAAMLADPARRDQVLASGVAETNRGVAVPAARPLDQTLIARRGANEMSDAELAALIRTAPRDTSFATRQEALFEKAWRSIPARFRIDESRNPERLAAVNTRAALGGIDANIASQIAGQREIRGALADRLRNTRAHFDMDELRAMRTEVGRALQSLDPNQTRLNGTQLKQLYGALSRDIEIGLQDIANRAYTMTRVGNNRPDQVAVEAARRADQALRDFRVADRYTRLGMERMGRFTRLLSAESPEAAIRLLATRMKEGTIDRGMIRAVTDALRPEERSQVLGHLIAQMGQRPGAKEAEHIWNLHTFATDWNKNKVALGLMTKGVDPSIRQRLDALAQISERMKYYETTKNYSGTAYAGLPFVGLGAQMIGGGASGFMSALAVTGGSAAVGKFLTTPRYLDWMVKAAQSGTVPRAGGIQVGGTHAPVIMSQLEKLAANDNELGPIISQAITLMNKRAAASEDEQAGPEGQQRQPQ